jgi:FkbM family methyltransferase
MRGRMSKFRKRRGKKLWKRALRSEGDQFCALFNARAKWLGLPGRIRFRESRYEVADDSKSVCFLHRKQGLMAYSAGLQARAGQLACDYMLDRVEFQSGDRVVDCGANVGDLLLYFEGKGLQVDYIGIEPSRNEFECLEHNARGHRLENVALWKESGELDFFVKSEFGDSSLIEMADYEDTVKVRCVSLDDLFPEDERIKLLKVEAEGAEPEILLGGSRMLCNVDFVTADLGFERGVDCESTAPEVVNFMVKNGFEVVEFRHQRVCVLFRNTAT